MFHLVCNASTLIAIACLYACRANIPVLRCLHQKITCNTHRFGKYVHIHFKEFKTCFDGTPTWRQFLMDGGKPQAPLGYLVLIEKGLRSFGTDIHAMGCGALTSAVKWKSVAVWRKREAYIALVRYLLERPSYQQWNCYKWQDYVEREKCNKTFLVRHLPLSDGDEKHFRGNLPNPHSWSDPAPSPKKKKRGNKKTTSSVGSTSGATAVATSGAPAAASAEQPPMWWDTTQGKFVPF